MQKLGSQMQTSSKTYNEAMTKLSTGRGNILKKTESLKELGAKATKSLPVELMNFQEDQETLEVDIIADRISTEL